MLKFFTKKSKSYLVGVKMVNESLLLATYLQLLPKNFMFEKS